MTEATEVHENIREAHEKSGSKWIAIYIACLAVLLAVGNIGGANAMKDMINSNISASNLWAFFQAKNMRQTSIRLAADQLEIGIAANPNMPEAVKQKMQDRIKSYRATVARYESDPKEGDGKKEIAAQARKHEAERARAQRRDPYFDYGEALIQIAIVLASVSLITGATFIIVLSGIMSTLGTLLMINGYTLWVAIGLLEH